MSCLAAIAWLNHQSPSRVSFVEDVPFTADGMSRITFDVAYKCEVIRTKAADRMLHVCATANRKFLSSTLQTERARYVVGGKDGLENHTNNFFGYDILRRQWECLSALPWTRSAVGTCAVGNRLVVMGGWKNGDVGSADIDEYNVFGSKWVGSTAKLSVANWNLTACADDQGGVYATGGHNSVLEKHFASPRVCSVMLKSDHFKRRDAVSVFDKNRNAIFVVGGRDFESTSEDFDSIVKYDISNNKCSQIGRMTTARSDLAVALVGDDLYMIGGFGDDKSLAVVEIFNLHTGKTCAAPSSMIRSRHGCNATTLDSSMLLCVLGGYGTWSAMSSVQTMDVREGKWLTGVIVPDMPHATCFFGFACV
jgi:hypothetical protein